LAGYLEAQKRNSLDTSVNGAGTAIRHRSNIRDALRDHSKSLIRANAASWATGFAEDPV
jgi:hypothetical protein